jgi:hypothetical protein
MRKALLLLVLGSIICGNCATARADHPITGFGAGIAGPAITIPATTLPKGKGVVAMRMEFIKFSTFSDAELREFAGQEVEAHSVDYLFAPSLGVGYGLTDNLTIGVRLPYVLRTDIREGHQENGEAEIHSHGNSDGIGDLSLLGQYRFLNIKSYNLECALLAGIKIPTGATGVKDRDGESFETEHQPGSGSWDPLLGLAAGKRSGSFSFDANVLYTFATQGAQRTNLGDRLNYNLAVSYRIGNNEAHHHAHITTEHAHLAWDLIFEANGEWQKKRKTAGGIDENSGGNLIYLSPGVRLCAGNDWAAALSVGVPVFEDLNGIQHETDVRAIFGISKGF